VEPQAFAADLLLAVLAVTYNGVAFLGQVNPDLVLAPCEQVDLKQAVVAVLPEHAITRLRELAFPGIVNGVHLVCPIFREIGGNEPFLLPHTAMDNGRVGLLELWPCVLEIALGGFMLGEQEYAGGVPIQPMDNENPVSGLCVPFTHVVRQEIVGGVLSNLVVADRKQPIGLIHNEDISILIENSKAFRLMPLRGTLEGYWFHGMKIMRVLVGKQQN